MLELWLVRHGVTDWNLEGRIQGWSDPPLNAAGRAQAEQLGPRLAGVAFDRVVASDLGRARATAALALPGAHVELDPRLRELNYGTFDGATWADLATGELAEAAAVWRADRRQRRIPGGESFDDLAARVADFRADLPATGRVIAFAHSGTIITALHGVLGYPEGRGWRLQIANTGITVLRLEAQRTQIVTVNDHAHLGAWATAAD